MKKQNIVLIIVLSFFLYSPVFLHAQDTKKPADTGPKVKWYAFEDAYKLNKKKPKKIFIDVFTEWCGWCKKMDAETFANPYIAKYMNDHYYCVKFDAERKDTIVLDGVTFVNPNPAGRRTTHQLANEFLGNKMSYPSYVFLNEKGQKLTVVSGYQQAKEFEGVLAYFGKDAYLKSTWEEFRSTFVGELK